MSKTVRAYDKFEYYLEDTDCRFCKFFKSNKRGCILNACCCEDIKLDALAHGRIKRKKGWDKWQE